MGLGVRLVRVARRHARAATLIVAGSVAVCTGAAFAATSGAVNVVRDPATTTIVTGLGLFVTIIGVAVRLERRLTYLETTVAQLKTFYDDLK